MSTQLSPAHRSLVLHAVLDAVARASPGAFSQGAWDRPGGAGEIDKHLDQLVEIVRRTTATRIEPFQVQVLDDICSTCPHQLPSTHCPLRFARQCLLYQNIAEAVEAIADGLHEIGDARYYEMHSPGMTAFLRNQN
jgi:hypothetical protein